MHAATTKVVKRVLGEKGRWGYQRYGVVMGLTAIHVTDGRGKVAHEVTSNLKWGPAAMIELHKVMNEWLERDWTKQMVAEQEGKRYRRTARTHTRS
jgi:hypothetical protein